MEKINVIKMLEEEKQLNDLCSRNLSKETYMKSVYNFIDVYVKPGLKRRLSNEDLKAPQEMIDELTNDISNDNTINEKDKEIMLRESTINAYYIDDEFKKLVILAEQLINELGLIDEKIEITEETDFEDFDININNYSYMLQEDEIGFLGKDKKIKKQVANKTIDYLIRRFMYLNKMEKYIEDYIIPMLNQYNKENKITFNLNSTDEKELLISNNIIEIAKQTICHNTGISIVIPFLKYEMSDEEINFHDFLFNDLEDNKKEFANFFCESILNEYKDFDFTNVKKFDLIDFINDDLNIMNNNIDEI